jgi:hypothetical protein
MARWARALRETAGDNARDTTFTSGTRKEMTDLTQPRNAAQKNAKSYFKQAELKSQTLEKQSLKKERAAVAANTAKLRGLRLAKEAAEKQAKDNLPVEDRKAPRRKRANPVRSVLRMTY